MTYQKLAAVIVVFIAICLGIWSFAKKEGCVAHSHDKKSSETQKPSLAPVLVYDKQDKRLLYSEAPMSMPGSDSIQDVGLKDGDFITIDVNDMTSFNVELRPDYRLPPAAKHSADTVLVLSDIEGKFSSFASFLSGNGVIDEDYSWSYGDNHIVLLGDFMDRGSEVFQCLWLIYKLEHEALKAGGNVHFVLGNHEMLNIRLWVEKAKMDYINPIYIDQANKINLPYKYWVSPWSFLGRWMRLKNCLTTVNDNLFIHGGVSLELIESGLTFEAINDRNRTLMNKPYNKFSDEEKLIFGKYGPYWYRGLADKLLTQQDVDKLLADMDINRIIMGHTIVHNDMITPLYEGKIIPIDLNHHNNFKSGLIRGLLIVNHSIYEVDNMRKCRPL